MNKKQINEKSLVISREVMREPIAVEVPAFFKCGVQPHEVSYNGPKAISLAVTSYKPFHQEG